jgi:hypothetical protein
MYNPGVEQTISLPDGRVFTLGRLTVGVLRSWRDWIANRVGDPFAYVEKWLGKIPEAESLRQLREAEEVRDQLRYFSLGAPLAARMLGTEEGGAQLLYLLLKASGKHPNATEDDGLALVLHLAAQQQLGPTLLLAEGTDKVGNPLPPAAS